MAGKIFNTLAEKEVISCQDLAGKLDGMIRSGLQGRILRGFSNMTAQDWMDLVVFSSVGVFANVPKDVDSFSTSKFFVTIQSFPNAKKKRLE